METKGCKTGRGNKKQIDEYTTNDRKRKAMRKQAKELGHNPGSFVLRSNGKHVSICQNCNVTMFLDIANNTYGGDMLTTKCLFQYDTRRHILRNVKLAHELPSN